MKLLSRYNRANIVTAVVILLASSITYYFIIRIILLQQIDQDLQVEEQEIHEYVKEHNALPDASAYKDQEIRFEKGGAETVRRQIKSATERNEQEKERVRMLTFPVRLSNGWYKATVIKSQVEAEDLLQFIVLITAAIFLLLLVVLFLVNRFLLNKLWQPFHDTLQQLRQFNLKNTAGLQLPSTKIDEFNELNVSVSDMTKRISSEYDVLKQFTENASHEMQTPIAIINSKLDLLAQTVNEGQVRHVESIYEAAARLSRLNKALLLISKIENAQYNEVEKINIRQLIEQKIIQFDELMKSRNIRIDCKLEDVWCSMNKELADILLTNLFSNAIKHNYADGYISCTLAENSFQMTNSGLPITFSEQHLFERFQKSNHSEGTGLGLAVVSQICEVNHIQIAYEGRENEHSFTLTFSTTS